MKNEQDGGFSAGVFGLGQFDKQLQSPSKPEDHLLSVIPERHVQQQPEPQGQRIRCQNAASTTCLRHGERQELLQKVTLGKIARKEVLLTLNFVNFSMKLKSGFATKRLLGIFTEVFHIWLYFFLPRIVLLQTLASELPSAVPLCSPLRWPGWPAMRKTDCGCCCCQGQPGRPVSSPHASVNL